MSAKLLSKKLHRVFKKPAKPREYRWRFLVMLPVWVTASFFVAQGIVVASIWTARFFGYDVASQLSEVVFQTLVAVTVYLLTFVISVGVPWVFFKRQTTLETLGLDRLMSWKDIGLTPLAYIAYMIILVTVLAIIMTIFPDFPINQVQDVGFNSLNTQYEFIMAFTILVVVGPIAEEVLFRGYLYGKLRAHVPIWAAVLVTSLLFALAHGQWNVAIDTFVLGVMLAALREVSGSIWAGILLHMLKNGIVFYNVFVVSMMFGGM